MIVAEKGCENHTSFGDHYANGLSTIKQVLTISGFIPIIKKNLFFFVELQQAFKDCQTIAEFMSEDSELMTMCFQAIFNADYFWD